jgi:hypothetical protein
MGTRAGSQQFELDSRSQLTVKLALALLAATLLTATLLTATLLTATLLTATLLTATLLTATLLTATLLTATLILITIVCHVSSSHVRKVESWSAMNSKPTSICFRCIHLKQIGQRLHRYAGSVQLRCHHPALPGLILRILLYVQNTAGAI